MPKIMLVSDHYTRVRLAEISPINPRYHPNESPKLKTQLFNSFVLLLKATNNNAENLKCVKHVNTSIVLSLTDLAYCCNQASKPASKPEKD